jgi:16S rRNA pseudouridine516 synthase
MKLSRLLSNQNGVSRKQANALIAAGQVVIDGQNCREPAQEVSRFANVTCQGQTLQSGYTAHYLMLYKPAGILSATTDNTHKTVMDLVDAGRYPDLHIAGRLDRASTGLILLTNDGQWSRALTEPASEKPKVYRVTTAYDFSPDTVDRFAAGIWFEYEQLTTRPAKLEPLSGCVARLTIHEGRYHQIKRMFHAVGNRVVALHREQIGDIRLDCALAPGDYRPLSQQEINSVHPT